MTRRPVDRLSRCEIAYLLAVADGEPDADVAVSLGVAASYVRQLARRARAKLGLENKAQTVAWVQRNRRSLASASEGYRPEPQLS